VAHSKILVLSGSSRDGSVNTMLANLAAARLKAHGADVTHVSLKDYVLPLVDATGFGNAPALATKLAELVLAQDGLFIVSPEYNAGYAPALKNALDWIGVAKPGAPGTTLSGKVVALGAVSPGAMGGYRGLTQLRTVLELGFGATLVPEMVAVGNAGTAFNADGSLSDERTAGFLDATLTKLVSMSAKLKA
jgi:chromate reductase, NAD(P)H dehydrogenase (quinone)